jgi:hypothetical protein
MPSGHFSESTGESMAVNNGKLFRTSEPFTQRSRSYCPFTDPTLQPPTRTSWKAWAPAPRTDLMRRSAKKWREGRPRHRVTNAPLDTCQRSPDQGAGRDTASEALAAQACVDAFFEAHRNRLSQGSHLHLQPYTSRPPTATDHSGPLWHRRPRFRVAAKVEIHPLDSRSQQDRLRSNHLSDTSAIEVRKRSLRDSFAGAFPHGEGGVGDLVASFLAATASSSARSFPLL